MKTATTTAPATITITIDPNVIERLIRRTASNPTLRFFCGPFTQTNDDLIALGKAAGLSEGMWLELAEAHQGGNRDMGILLADTKQLMRHCRDAAHDPDRAATCSETQEADLLTQGLGD